MNSNGFNNSNQRPGDALIEPLEKPADVKKDKHFKPTGYWLFLANPKRWDANKWMLSGHRELTYIISKDDQNYMKIGDLGLIRVNKKNGKPAEIIAAVEIIERPCLRNEEDNIFLQRIEDRGVKLRVKLEKISSELPGVFFSNFLPEGPDFKYIHNGVKRSTIPISGEVFLTVAKYLGVDGYSLEARRKSRTRDGIRVLEAAMFNDTPIEKERKSKCIERGSMGNWVKAKLHGKCQICEKLGRESVAFKKPDGMPYSEAHHVIPVAKLEKGSLGFLNIMVLCPNHHREVHYGNMKIEEKDRNSWRVKIGRKTIIIDKVKE
ncbi:HNH endonuclease [Zavarzinia sp.]|uniref:HNH endonuclease n=1 Tax=Zavarzinia sp. TaxID=2027920 RepID=UPI003BB5A055